MRKLALITGASAGIGTELVRAFARGGYQVVLTARRLDRLETLAQELGGRAIAMDLADPGAPARLHAQVGPVDVLVNNAGFGAVGRFAELPLDRQLAMLQVNVTALTELMRLYLPQMVASGSGRVLNVASTVSFQPVPGLALYGATKAFVLSFSEAVQAELAGTGVTVTCLCPGATETEFAEVAGLAGSKLFRRTMTAEAVARLGYEATLRGERLVVAGAMNAARTLAVRVLPRALVLWAGRKVMLG
jgi:short-subunit dehydrogenase